MSSPTSDGTKSCPHCAADCYATAARCWLCYTQFGQPPEIVMAEVVSGPPQQTLSEWFFAILTILAIGFVVVVGVGVTMQEPMQGLVYAVVVSLPLAASAIRMHSKKTREGSLRWSERFATLMVSAAVTLGILGALAVAGVVALFVWCLTAFSGSGFH